MTQCHTVIRPETLAWDPHPRFRGVTIGYLVTSQRDGIDITCAMVRLPAGAGLERHVHERSDDIIYVLAGKARMEIDGAPDVPLTAGTFLRIPCGVAHRVHDIEEDTLLYDVWYPALD